VRDRPDPKHQTTTLWDFPSQNYGEGRQGDTEYRGATPSHVIWNLLERYTRRRDLVVDPMCGSGTTVDVARDLERRGLGYDLQPQRRDLYRADARTLPLEDGVADFAFVDPPYGTHLKYSGLPECIGELDAFGDAYYEAMDQVFAEIERVLHRDRYLAVYVSDSFEKGRGFAPVGTRLASRLERRFRMVDHVAVVRHNKDLDRPNWHAAAREGNYMLRGFHHLLVFAKGDPGDRRER